jgi:hypothetical protein
LTWTDFSENEGSRIHFGGLVDTVYADAFMERNGIGVLNIPLDSSRREQYLKRLEKRRELLG